MDSPPVPDADLLLAHLSDPHVGPLTRPRLVELAGKRLTGYINWRRGRHAVHSMAALETITADMLAQKPDHVALTGDLVNIGHASEFVTARRYLERIGPPEFVSAIPGNHDIYVRSSLPHLIGNVAPWMCGDGEREPSFPYRRVRNGVALIGLSSGIVTPPFFASGALGRRQLAALEALLVRSGAEGLVRVVMIHHPPHAIGTRFGRGLRDAPDFEAAIARAGVELVIHGHNHRASVVRLGARNGMVPVVGVASASAVPGSANHLAAYHTYRIGKRGNGRLSITMVTRGLGPQGEIRESHREQLV
jgi:3',5'-cyclic AMP phosphodiesterase CpdA